VSRTVLLFPRGYPSESLAKANSRWKVISVCGARLISYRSRIFIAATRTRAYLCTDVCARNDTRLRPRDRIRSEGWKNTVAAVFCGRVESGGDGSATMHTLCFINCSMEKSWYPLLRLFTIMQVYYFSRVETRSGFYVPYEREYNQYLINI